MELKQLLEQTTAALTDRTATQVRHPSTAAVERIIVLCREVLFARHYLGCCSSVAIEGRLGELFRLLEAETSTAVAKHLVEALPELRRVLWSDIEAIFQGDPAADSHDEIIFCYPSLTALLHHRVAHLLYQMQVPIIPRLIAEMAHSATGIDIHPGATIGERFAIDHGTGVVIGQTTIIGQGVRLYQGVTLGARSFRSDANGGYVNEPRHPILEDNVVVYSNTSILGRITIGAGSVIGGNCWITGNVPPGTKITQTTPQQECSPLTR